MTRDQVQSIREELWDGGFRPVGIYNIDANHTSPGKAPIGEDWQGRARQDPPAAVLSVESKALNTGILCDGLRALDLDLEDAALVQKIRAMAIFRLGEAPMRVRANSARCLLLYRATTGEPPKRMIAGTTGKVEVLGRGQQFVAFGFHPTGAELRWMPEAPNTINRDTLPMVTEEQIGTFLREIAPLVGATGEKASNAVEGSHGAEVRALQTELAACGAAQISLMDDLDDDLLTRLHEALANRPNLYARWEGASEDMAIKGRDTSRSGLDFSMASLLKGAGFTAKDTALCLLAFKHGAAFDDLKHPTPNERLRYVALTAVRASVARSAARLKAQVSAMPPTPPSAAAAPASALPPPSASPAASAGLLDQLQRTREGVVQPSLANLALLFGAAPELIGLVGFNEFTQTALLMKAPPAWNGRGITTRGPFPRAWTPADVGHILAYLQASYNPRWASATVEQAMLAEAEHNAFHPVREWLNALRWDGVERLDTWLNTVFGSPDDTYHQDVGRKMLIAAVRRVRQPGCKWDQMPVLDGRQGIGKSRAVRELFSPQWFTDSLPADLESKDAALALMGAWCVECGEIEHLIRSEVEVVKAFLSRSVDRYRPPYGKDYVERPRQCVIIGTTNAQSYLRDATGNRRFWPISCTKAEPGWIADHREQLWAEAAEFETQGEPIWLDESGTAATAGEKQDSRMEEDAWLDVISKHLERESEVSIPDLLEKVLYIAKAMQDRKAVLRAANILTGLGWRRHVVRIGGLNAKRWRPAEKERL